MQNDEEKGEAGDEMRKTDLSSFERRQEGGMEGRRGGRKESTEPRAVTWREWGGKELAGDRSLPPPDGLGLPEPPASPLSSGLSPARRDCLCSPHPQWSCSSREPARGSGLPVVCACLCLPDSSSTRSYWGREVRLGEGQADCK